MKKIIDVHTGEVKAGRKNAILKSSPIGSCVVIVAYNSGKKVGALAHVMLPGSSPNRNTPQRTKYATDAIDVMINRMTRLGAGKDDIEVCLVGGGNVLRRKDDTICKDNIASVIESLKKKRIKIRAKAVGGTKRRNLFFDVEEGNISYTEGSGEKKLLWKGVAKT